MATVFPWWSALWDIATMSQYRRGSLALPAAVLIAASTLTAGPVGAAPDDTASYIVQLTAGTPLSAAQSVTGGTVRAVFTHAIHGVVVDLPPSAAEALARNPRVVSIEPDGIATTTGTQVQPTWGLDRIDQSALPLSGSYTFPDSAGTGVTVYVFDTGVQADHSDLSGRVTPGWSSIDATLGTTDCHGHGTHVAGTIAGTTYGVAKSAVIKPVKVLDCAGSGPDSGVIAAINWAIVDHTDGPAVANFSLGTTKLDAMNTAIQNLVNDGVTVAVAAGNDYASACNSSPASAPAALTVGATDSSDTRAVFSNFGSCLDLFAPGVSITSAKMSGGSTVKSGTSMASPHVAGAAALLLGQDRGLSPVQVADRITSTATVGTVVSAGSGSPNRLLFTGTGGTAPPTVPAPATPVTVVAEAGSLSAIVSWAAGSGGGTPTGHTIRVYRSNKSNGSFSLAKSVTVGPGTTSPVTGLSSRSWYRFGVIATNGSGSSPESTRSTSVKPLS
jgi:subtilisin family serine protease